jgi:hypothetical protein
MVASSSAMRQEAWARCQASTSKQVRPGKVAGEIADACTAAAQELYLCQSMVRLYSLHKQPFSSKQVRPEQYCSKGIIVDAWIAALLQCQNCLLSNVSVRS